LWQLTEKGYRFHREDPRGLSDAELATITTGDYPVFDPPVPLSDTPDERIAGALLELRTSIAKDLLERILGSTPEFFEQLVLKLLHALGYGTGPDAGQRVGRSGDGGIDGVISLDRLGFEKVYIQAKRWQNNVGRPEVQAFSGALIGQRASKGVLITTAEYTPQAREFAASVADRIVLIGGDQLTQLMLDYGVGVSHKALQIPSIDSDFFEDS
jgi:restriction system protein